MDNASILLDKRTLERNIRQGLISEKEFTNYLTALPDMENEAVEISLDGSRDEEEAESDENE